MTRSVRSACSDRLRGGLRENRACRDSRSHALPAVGRWSTIWLVAAPIPPNACTQRQASSCSATACSPVRQSSAKDGQAGSPVSIPCCARWRSRGGSAAATSSKVLVARSSRCQERSIDCAPCASRAAGSSRSRRRIPPTRMARCCPGRIRMDGWRGRQAPIASLKMDGLSFTSSVAGARC